MCYDVSYQIKKAIKYGEHYGLNKTELNSLKDELKQYEEWPEAYHLNGFEFPKLPIITNTKPKEIQFFTWGLIPSTYKTLDSANNIRKYTLNARAETLDEKKSFKEAIKENRCLVLLDGFFEYHHFKSKTFPFFISKSNGEPIVMAGIFNKANINGEVIETVSIVTTKANEMMSKIHNNPKLEEPRMPVILEKKDYLNWLDGDNYESLLKPLPDGLLKAHTVKKIRTRYESINDPEVIDEYSYPELPKGYHSIKTENEQFSLF